MDIKTNKNTIKEEEYSPDLKTWKAEARENYGGLYQSSALTVPVYTKTQMRSIYPNGKYQTVAEYSPKSKKRQTEMLISDETALPLYRYGTNSRIVYEEKGFLAVDKRMG